jgi:uncharacterized protein with GYD domain
MAKEDKKKKESQQEAIDKFLAKAKKRLEFEIKQEADNRREAIECLMFTVPGNQWPTKDKDDRTKDGRPCLEIPLFHKFTAQVVGDMLHNRARVSIKPVDSKADPHIAKIRAGIISNTEYISNAEDIYLEAGKMQVSCGYGAWRVGTRYCEDNPFLQEIYKELIPNAFMVYTDSKRKDAAGADSQYGFVLSKMLKEDFEEYWPNAKRPDKMPALQGARNEIWYDNDTITVAEYFIVKPEKQTFCQLEDGTVLPEDDAKELIASWEALYKERVEDIQAGPSQGPPTQGMPPQAPPAAPVPGAMPPQGAPPQAAGGAAPPQGAPAAPPATPSMPPRPKITAQRTTPVNRIRHYTITMNEILPPRKDAWEEYRKEDDLDADTLLGGEPVPGKYIPIVEVSGPTLNIEGKIFRKGLIKDIKDAQRLVNYYETALAEIIALAPKSPWLATGEQIEGYENDYLTANTKNFAVLKYNAVIGDNGQLLPPPIRQSPGQPPVALFNQVQRAHDNLKAVLGMFGGDVGEVGPERSAPAVTAKQRPGDVSTYVYAYNLNRAIEHSGKIANAMIPEVYDSERDVRLRNVDDTEAIVPINTSAETAAKTMRNNPDRYKGMNTTRLVELIQKHGKGAKFNDITVGKYDVVVTVGPSYATQRQETAQMLAGMRQNNPQGMAKYDDIFFENMDFKDADRMASRARRTMPPGLVELREGEKPYVPPVPPQIQVLMQKGKTEAARERTAQAKEQVALLQAKVKMIELYKEIKESEAGIRSEILKTLQELHAVEAPQPQIGG